MARVEQSGRDGSVDVRFEGDVGVLTMRRGQNRINEQFIDQMNEAMDKVLANPNAKALVTTGEGRFYSNGLDLDWLIYIGGAEPDRLDKFAKGGLTELTARLITFPLPTIALLNGHAFAGGAILAASHDHVIMQNQRGWWCTNEVHIKMRFSPFLITLLKMKLPTGRTMNEAVILGRRFTADEAVQAGVVQDSCKPEEMLPRALAWVKSVLPPGGFDRDHLKIMKEDVYQNVLELQGLPTGGQFPGQQYKSKM